MASSEQNKLNRIADDLMTKARTEGWSRKRVRHEIFDMNEPSLWERRDEILSSLGHLTTEEAAGKAAKEEAENRARISAEHAEARANAKREADLRTQIEREQADAKEAEVEAFRNEEKKELEGVEPHWPTYREVLHLAAECREFSDAVYHRDTKDAIAFKRAPEALGELAECCLLDDRSVAADILRKTKGAMTDKQAKLVAIILSKLAAKNGMTGSAPLSADTAHLQELASAEIEEIAITLDRELKQRVNVRLTATKKTGKPYMAKLGAGFSREFAPRRKFTNTQHSFFLEGLRIGDVVEFRGYGWNGSDYSGGTDYAVIGNGVIYFISRGTARLIADGADGFAIDSATPVMKLSPDATIPPDLQNYTGESFEAWLVDEDGRPVDVNWPEDEDENEE